MAKDSKYSIEGQNLKFSYRNILLLLSIFWWSIIFVCLYGATHYAGVNRNVSLLCAILCIVMLAMWFVFLFAIYIPMSKIEKALNVFVQYGEDFQVELSPSNATWPIVQSLNYIHTRISDSIAREYIATMKQKDAEIHALQNQINPHFLYNTLDSIRGLALLNDDDEAADMIEALSVFFRYSIGQKGHIVTLREELENINSYLFIQNNRFKDKLSFDVRIDDDDEKILDCQFPKLLLQPIIENAVFHGIEPKVGPGHITIRVFAAEDRLTVSIKDNGIGMDEEELNALKEKIRRGRNLNESLPSRGNGIALININQRILLNYGEQYGLTVASTKGVGSEVELTIPIIYNEEKQE